MKAYTIDGITNDTVRYLDNVLLDRYGRIKLLPASYYHALPPYHLIVWATQKARYTIPTVELVTWLKRQIRGRKAIEIGSGNGDLGYHLGIRMTDNYCHHLPQVQVYYKSLGQQTTNPCAMVEQIDAVAAVIKYRPDVVVASFVTQKAYENTPETVGASMYGPEEEDILRRTDCYIHVGNDNSHQDKRIKKYTHRVYHPDWLVTKARDQRKNSIYVWGS